jgi:putative spermidine/putrescine transport system substrate-binding protein
MRISRLMKMALVLTLATFLAACAGASPASTGDGAKKFQGETLRIAMWGGGWQAGQHEAMGKWFEETTGAKVEYVAGNPRNHIQKLIAAKGGEPPFDLVHMDDVAQELAASQGLLEQMDPEWVPGMKDVFPEAFANKGYGPGFVIIQFGIAYNTEEYKKLGIPEPKTIGDLWNPSIKGKVAIPGLGVSMGPYAVTASALQFGGSQDNIEPGLQKLKELDPIVYTDSSKLETMFINKEVIAAIWIDGRTNSLAAKGHPVKFVRVEAGNSGKIGGSGFDTIDLVKGTKKKELAKIWVERQFSVEGGMAVTKRDSYGPTNAVAAAELAKEEKYKNTLITNRDAMKKTLVIDAKKLNANINDWVERFNKALAN